MPDKDLEGDGPSLELPSFGFGRKKPQDEDTNQLAEEFKQWSSYQQMLAQWGIGGELSDYRSAYLFGDRTLQSMSLVDGAVLFVEGSPQIRADVDPAQMAAMWGGTPPTLALKPRTMSSVAHVIQRSMRKPL